MFGFSMITPSGQVAAYLRGELQRGRWSGLMPGEPTLAAELGVDHKTVQAALRLLEEERILESQGPGRRRKITLRENPDAPPLRVAILLGEKNDMGLNYMVELMHGMEEAGYMAKFAPQSLTEIGGNVERVARMVGEFPADAWVVVAGSREVLEWFASRPLPAIALFGRRARVNIAGVGPDKSQALVTATRRLITLGHRRIVMLSRTQRRLPAPGKSERAFLAVLEAQGIPTSTYNLPHWEETIDSFHECLGSLFGLSPPTALIIDEAPHLFAAQQFLAERGLASPRDVSMICLDPDPAFSWSKPAISHIRWDSRPVVRRIMQWAANLTAGKDDRRKTDTAAEFVEGGTIGSARK